MTKIEQTEKQRFPWHARYTEVKELAESNFETQLSLEDGRSLSASLQAAVEYCHAQKIGLDELNSFLEDAVIWVVGVMIGQEKRDATQSIQNRSRGEIKTESREIAKKLKPGLAIDKNPFKLWNYFFGEQSGSDLPFQLYSFVGRYYSAVDEDLNTNGGVKQINSRVCETGNDIWNRYKDSWLKKNLLDLVARKYNRIKNDQSPFVVDVDSEARGMLAETFSANLEILQKERARIEIEKLIINFKNELLIRLINSATSVIRNIMNSKPDPKSAEIKITNHSYMIYYVVHNLLVALCSSLSPELLTGKPLSRRIANYHRDEKHMPDLNFGIDTTGLTDEVRKITISGCKLKISQFVNDEIAANLPDVQRVLEDIDSHLAQWYPISALLDSPKQYIWKQAFGALERHILTEAYNSRLEHKE